MSELVQEGLVAHRLREAAALQGITDLNTVLLIGSAAQEPVMEKIHTQLKENGVEKVRSRCEVPTRQRGSVSQESFVNEALERFDAESHEARITGEMLRNWVPLPWRGAVEQTVALVVNTIPEADQELGEVVGAVGVHEFTTQILPLSERRPNMRTFYCLPIPTQLGAAALLTDPRHRPYPNVLFENEGAIA